MHVSKTVYLQSGSSLTLRAESYTILAGAMFSASSYVQVNQMFKLTMSSALLFEDYTTVQDSCASQLELRSGESFQTDFSKVPQLSTENNLVLCCFHVLFHILEFSSWELSVFVGYQTEIIMASGYGCIDFKMLILFGYIEATYPSIYHFCLKLEYC